MIRLSLKINTPFPLDTDKQTPNDSGATTSDENDDVGSEVSSSNDTTEEKEQ